MGASDAWPELPYEAWRDTLETVHRWAQIVGKVRLARAPMTDGWWQVPLYVTARGLSTSPIPAGERVFELAFDFITHELRLDVSDGTVARIPLAPRPVADFYDDVMRQLADAGLATPIWPVPVELLEPSPERFDRDRLHASYDSDAVHRWWRILIQTDQALKEAAARFLGRVSPVHFFWGTFDLALSRYSGRRVEPAPRTNVIERYAFDQEQVECGFWPGDTRLPAPAFYAFASPPPSRDGPRRVLPGAARFDAKLGEYVLLYDDVRLAPDPRRALLDFFQSSYEAEATGPGWDHAKLDWQPPAKPTRIGG
jgi:hypothetical protein